LPNHARVRASNVAASLRSQRGGRVQILHLVNHNYNQRNHSPRRISGMEVDVASMPRRITTVSRDFAGRRTPAHIFCLASWQ
jgi:hypothetical protein